jgi:hypothetical protein
VNNRVGSDSGTTEDDGTKGMQLEQYIFANYSWHEWGSGWVYIPKV